VRVRQRLEGVEFLLCRLVAQRPLPGVPLALDHDRFLGRVVYQLEGLPLGGIQRLRLLGHFGRVSGFVAKPRQEGAHGRHRVRGTEHPGVVTHPSSGPAERPCTDCYLGLRAAALSTNPTTASTTKRWTPRNTKFAASFHSM